MLLSNVMRNWSEKRKWLGRALVLACSLGISWDAALAQSGYRPSYNSTPVNREDDEFDRNGGREQRYLPSRDQGGSLYGGGANRRWTPDEPVVPRDRPRYRDDNRREENRYPQSDRPQRDNAAPRDRWDRIDVQPRYRPEDDSRTAPRAPRYQAPASQPVVDPIEAVHQRLQRRYKNSSYLSLLNQSPQMGLQLYGEILDLIDQRHIEPTPLQSRVEQGVLNLVEGLRDPVFVQTNRLNLAMGQGDQFGRSLQQMVAQARFQSNQQAVAFVGQVAQMAQQQAGLHPTVVVMEFVYGACESLDKYSTFVPPERSPGASLQLEEKVVGIGVQLEIKDRGAEIVKVISNSPALEQGLKKGDLIVSVGQQSLDGLDLDRTVDLIAGPAGTPVQLMIQRGSQQAFPVSIPRRSIQLNSVTDVQMLGSTGVGYFKLEKFTATSSTEMDQALWTLHQQGMKSLVLDLRGDPGGLLTAAVEISDKFLPQGVIVSTKGRTAADNSQEVAKYPNTWKVPLVVLIDKNSASASEIFAAAIQENQRGLIVGRTSYGKGTVQTQFPLRTADCSVRLTTARFFSPNGRVMAGAGVTPDQWIDEVQNSNYQEPLDHDVQEALRIATQQLGGGMDLTRTQPNRTRNGY